MRRAFRFAEPLVGRALAIGAALGIAAGCWTAPPPERYRPALSPHGREVELTVRPAAAAAIGGRRVHAELLAVTDSALLVQRDQNAVMLVKWTAIESAYVSSAGAWLNRAPNAKQASRWRLLCRFPQGIPAPMLERLLTERGQPSVVVVGQ